MQLSPTKGDRKMHLLPFVGICISNVFSLKGNTIAKTMVGTQGLHLRTVCSVGSSEFISYKAYKYYYYFSLRFQLTRHLN